LIIQFPFFISVIPVALSGAIVLVGLVLFIRVHKAAGSIVLLFGVLIGAVFGPMLFMDRVVVDDERIEQRTGFWFAPTVKGFDLAGIERILITEGRDLKQRPIELWVAEYPSRPAIRVDPGDLWEMNGRLIVDHLTRRGVTVIRSKE